MVVDELIEDIFEEIVTLKKIQPRINDHQSFDELFSKKKDLLVLLLVHPWVYGNHIFH